MTIKTNLSNLKKISGLERSEYFNQQEACFRQKP